VSGTAQRIELYRSVVMIVDFYGLP